jgi:hypothetical protein
MTIIYGLKDIPGLAKTILKGGIRGRAVIDTHQ